MREPSRMTLPSAAAMPISKLDFSFTAKRRLRSLGIASALQLAEIADRDPGKLRHATGVTATRARRVLEKAVGVLPDFSNTAMTFAPLPPSGLAIETHPMSSAAGSNGVNATRPTPQLLSYLDALVDLPSRVSLVPHMSAVGDQGPWGTCVGWAANALREYALGRAMSPGYAYRGAKSIDGLSCEGSFLRCAMQHLYGVGHVSEDTYNYRAAIRGEPIAQLAGIAASARSGGWASVDVTQPIPYLPKLMRASLAGRLRTGVGPQPIGIGLRLFRSFATTSTALDGLIYNPFPNEEHLGGHAMSVVGYIDSNDPGNPFEISYFMVRNSWGSTWAAENPFDAPGHAMIPETYFADRRLVLEAVICLGGQV